MFYTYIIRCEDNSLYTGYTNDIEKRIKNHFTGNKVAAKYTKSHKPVKVEAIWTCKEKIPACKLEYHIKKLNKIEKEMLLNGTKISELLSGKIDGRKYRKKDINYINSINLICKGD